MAAWEYFATFFGKYFAVFVVFIGHSSYFFVAAIISWPSNVLARLQGTEDNPLGRPITSEESDLIGSLLYVGASIGPFIFAHAGKKIGRKKVWIVALSIVPISHGLLIFGDVVEVYYICRLCSGIYIGAILSIVPAYISEIIHPDDVTFFMSFESMFAVSGAFYSNELGPILPLYCFNLVIVIASILFIILLAIGCPESPYFVMRVEGKDEAKKLLKKLRANYVEKELEHIEKTLESENSKSNFEFFKKKKYFKYFLLATIPLLLQQFCGVTLIITYIHLIFLETNFIPSQIMFMVIVGLSELTVFLAPLLLKSGRMSPKSIMIFCLTGTGLCNLVMSLYFFYGINFSFFNWVPLTTLILFNTFYNSGLDPIVLSTLGQTYPKNVDFIGTACSSSVYYLSVFPMLYSFYKVDIPHLFLWSFVCCFMGIVYVKFVFKGPEKAITDDIPAQSALI